MGDDDILHEIRKLQRWKLDRECLELNETQSSRFFEKFNPKRFFPKKDKDIAEHFDCSLQWQFAVPDSDRTLLAILQDRFLEIRHKRDEYDSTIARTIVVPDTKPSWRKLTWSCDGILIAFSFSNGAIECFDALLKPLCSIPQEEDSGDTNSLIPYGALVSLFLIEKRTRSIEWPYELLALDYTGRLRSYFVSPTKGYKPYHTFSFCDTVLSSAVYVSLYNILVVAFPVNNLTQKTSEDTLGLSSWRLLNDYPYYRLVKPSIENLDISKVNKKWLSFMSSNNKRTVVIHMTASNSSQLLGCIHSCGAVSIWLIPQMTLHKLWRLPDLPRYQINQSSIADEYFPTDLNWCSEKKLAMISRSGLLISANINSLENLLSFINPETNTVDRQPEQVNTPAKLINSCDINNGLLVLDCEIKKCSARRDSQFSCEDFSSSTALEVVDNLSLFRQYYNFFIHFEFFQQQKKMLYIEKTYSLTFLKKVTPEELYSKKINTGDYEEALQFARLFNLDENRVYKKQWQTNPVTEDSIKKYLSKVSNKWWILNECVQRIPETLSAAKTLLKYGLQLTGFDAFLEYREISEPDENDSLLNFDDINIFSLNQNTTENFTSSQLLIFQRRRYLLLCWDALSVYEKIIELNSASYCGEMYRKFRTDSSLSLALKYARDGNIKAVEVLFAFLGEKLQPFWLKIMDDFPECLSPLNYKQLLPRVNEHQKLISWKCKRIREADWSESGNFKELMLRQNSQVGEHNDIPQYPFSFKYISTWYENKIRRIVDECGLVDHALELLNLARKNGITSLDYLQHNLLVLDAIMYELVIEDEINLSQIESYEEIDKLMLLMSKSNSEEQFLDNVVGILLPFINRCESLNPNSRDTILDEYFKRLSEHDLTLPLIFFTYVTQNDQVDVLFSNKRKLELGLLTVYACQRVDEINLAMKIVQCLPEVVVTENNNIDYEELYVLHSRISELQDELEVLQLLRNYHIERSVQYLHANKNNIDFQKFVLTEMVNGKVNRMNFRPISNQEIGVLLEDMKFVQEFFVSLHNQMYLRIFAYTMLTLNRVDCIENYAPLVMTCSSASLLRLSQKQRVPINPLSYDESVAIIVEAAQYYFNIASSYDDTCITLSKACLSLVNSHPDVDRENKLICALQELNNFDIFIPPLKIRMTGDKMRIIEKVLKHNPQAYKQLDKLLSLANNLDTEDGKKSLEFEVLSCAVDAAFQLKDFPWCSKIVEKFTASNYPYWEICKKLCESEEYEDLSTKQNLIRIAILQCSSKEISLFVDLRNEIERKILRQKLQNTVQQIGGESRSNDESRVVEENASSRQLQRIESLQNIISISSLTNILQISSANVLNVDYWKKTLSFRPDVDRSEIEVRSDVDLKKLAYPEFYKSIHEHNSCTCSSGYLPMEKEKEVFRLLLRYYLLSNRNCGSTDDLLSIDINDVITQLAVTLYPNDCVSSLCLSLMLNDEASSEKVFSSLPPSDNVEKFALYYYSLKIASTCEEIEYSILRSPSKLVSKVLNLVDGDSNSIHAKLFNRYKSLLEKRRGISKLQDLGCGIDSVRFFSDEDYKVDSILGVAMFEERDKLYLALDLGKEYGVSNEDIVLSHITSLFLTGNLSVLTERLKEPKILEMLKAKSSYVTERIISNIYEGLYGCDYQIMLLYYALLNQVADNEVIHFLKPKEHMKLLRKLKTFSKCIDYKLLTSEPPKIVEAVMPAVFGNEISHIMNFLFSLPIELKNRVNFEEILEQVAEKVFFNGPANLSYIRRFELSRPFLERIPEIRIRELMQKFLFSKFSWENIDNEERKHLLESAINNFSNKLETYSSVVEYLKNYSKQFKKIDELNEICRAIDLDEAYLRDLQTSFIHNDDAELKRIVLKMVLDFSISADVIKVILEFVRMDSLTDIISDMLNSESRNKGNVESLIQRIENCLEDNEYEKCWYSPLKWFLDEDEVTEAMKSKITKILSVLERSEDEIYESIELLHESRLILRDWNDAQSLITLFDLTTEDTRMELVAKLLKQVDTCVQAKHILRLLQLWPPFNFSEWENDPWMLLLERVLQFEVSDVEGLKMVEKIIAKCNPTKETRRAFFEHVTSLNHNKALLIWYCLATKDELLIQSVNGYINELRETNEMPQVIETSLKQMRL